ncbi:MAG: serine/threonine-protein kinase, partial [Planctomycetota bacterium]
MAPAGRSYCRGMGLENYEIGEELLAAGPSTFYRARNAILGNDVMLRRLALDPGRGRDVYETFYREQRLSAALAHRHIQRALDVFEAEGHLWSVHEFLNLRTASQIAEQTGPFSVAEAARIGSQVADALAHMHAQGYVHGKVSPAVVMLDGRGETLLINLVKSADLAAGIWPLREAVLGLSPYSAPEEFAGVRPTPAHDLYGLAGAIVYWLTMKPPRGGDSPEASLERARTGAPLIDLRALRPDVPQMLADRLVAALAADPADRHGSVASLGSVLVELYQRLAAEIPSGFGPGARLQPACCDV